MASKEEEDRSCYQSIPESRKINRPLSPDSLDADIEPSSSENEDNGASDGHTPTNEQPFKELQDSSEKPAMSNKRRICLVGSLLLCVFTVFAFAFILPCHHKTCLKETKWPNWSKNFTGIFPLVLRDFDTNDSSSKRLVVGFTHQGLGFHILNHTCPGCHGGVVAVNGGNGDQVWASGTFGQLKNVICDLTVKQQEQSSCIALEDHDKLLRIDTHNGYQHWTTHRPGPIKAFRTIRDIDDDGVGEVVVLHGSTDYISELCVLSGQTGQVIGISLPVLKRRTQPGLQHEGFLHVHHLSNSQVLLIGVKLDSQETGTLIAIRIDELVTRIHNKSIQGLTWGHRVPDRDGFIQLYDTLVLTEPLFADLNNDGVLDIVICTLDAGLTVEAINGKNTSQIWSRKLTSSGIHGSVPSIVLLGDKTIDIAIMIHLTNQSTRIVVISGKNGLAQWMFTLKHPLTVPPVGVAHKSHIPRGLLLWLPQVKITQHLSKREVGVITDFKTRNFGQRVKRDATGMYLNQRDQETPRNSLLNKLKGKRKRANDDMYKRITKAFKKDDGDDFLDNDEDFVNSILQLQKDSGQTNSYTRTEGHSDINMRHSTNSPADDHDATKSDDNLRKTTNDEYFDISDEQIKRSVDLYHHQDDDDDEHDDDYNDDSLVTTTADFMADQRLVTEKKADVITNHNTDVNIEHHPIREHGADVITKHPPITVRNDEANVEHRPLTERHVDFINTHLMSDYGTYTKRNRDVITEDRPITDRNTEKKPITEPRRAALSDDSPETGHISDVHNGHVPNREHKAESHVRERHTNFKSEYDPITKGEDDVIFEYRPITERHADVISEQIQDIKDNGDVIPKLMTSKRRPIAERHFDTVSATTPVIDRKDDGISDHRPFTEGKADVASDHRPITERDADIMSDHRPITESQESSDNLSELRDFLLNLEGRLKRETLRETNPTQTVNTTTHHNPPTIRSTSSSTQTMSSTTHAKSPDVQTMFLKEQNTSPTTQDARRSSGNKSSTSENFRKQATTQEDKPLNCDLPVDKTNRAISAVLVYRDAKNQLQLMEIAREQVLYIAPEDFVNKFGEQPPMSYSCVPLVPMATTTPIVADIDGDHRPDLVFTIDYVTFNQSTKTRKSHLMKLRKVDILDAIDDKKKGQAHTKLYKSEKKNYKRNENFDSPFLKWET